MWQRLALKLAVEAAKAVVRKFESEKKRRERLARERRERIAWTVAWLIIAGAVIFVIVTSGEQ